MLTLEQLVAYLDFQHPMQTYSCRFELSQDVTQFIILAYTSGVQVFVHSVSQPPVTDAGGTTYYLPDTLVEFNSPADLETLRNVLRQGQDLHVALQTLKPCLLAQNPLERDYNLI